MTRLGRGFFDRALEASIVGSFTRVGPLVRQRSEHWSPLERMDGRTVLVTGATSGLGLSGARVLAELGAYVIGVGRNAAALRSLGEELGAHGETWSYDLADLEQARELAQRAQQLSRLDVVIHNAGTLSREYQLTPQGFELTLGVHLLSPYLITRELCAGATTAPERIIFMTSGGMYAEKFDLDTLEMNATNYQGVAAYARAKRAQVVLTAALAAAQQSVSTRYYAVHPGWAKTPGVADSLPVFNRLAGPLLRSAREGIDGALWLASERELPPSGHLWLDREIRPEHRWPRTRSTNDQADQTRLINWLIDRIDT